MKLTVEIEVLNICDGELKVRTTSRLNSIIDDIHTSERIAPPAIHYLMEVEQKMIEAQKSVSVDTKNHSYD